MLVPCFVMQYLGPIILSWLLFLNLSSWCIEMVSVLGLFVMVQCVGLQCVIVVFPDHIHLLFTYIPLL